MNPLRELDLNMTRRQLFGRTAMGVGTAALHRLLAAGGMAGISSLVDAQMHQGTHFAPKAKSVIYLFMSHQTEIAVWSQK